MDLQDLWTGLEVDLCAEFRSYRERLSTLEVREKSDRTLLTVADVAVQELVTRHVRAIDATSPIIAEEDSVRAVRSDVAAAPDRVWVIDPIDGTSQFVDPELREFCTAVCLLDKGTPTAAFVLAPELDDGRPVLVIADAARGTVSVNGSPARPAMLRPRSLHASVTGRGDSVTAAFRARLSAAGYTVKTKATSQTIDLVRTCVDLDGHGLARTLPGFDVFRREQQKIWDGLAGICLAQILGLRFTDDTGRPRLPVSPSVLVEPEPAFDSTIVGRPEVLEWLLAR
jgi:3'(2'), 5'-bisphosphate nucleotidase